MILDDKGVFVAGACGLLGFEIVNALLIEGARVYAADLDIELLKERFSQQVTNPRLSLIKLDVTIQSELSEFFSQTINLDGAVNCSYPRNKNYGANFSKLKIKDFNDNVALHLGSSVSLMQQCALYFEKTSRPFSLVNIASIYGVVAPKFEIYNSTHMTTPIEYAAIKSAIIHLNKYVAAYVNNSDFRVNSISPGGLFDNQLEIFRDAYKEKTLGAGMLEAHDILKPIIFLLSTESKYINGQNIIVDDGFHL